MQSSDLERHFRDAWADFVKQCEKSLEPDDLAQAQLVTSWDQLQREMWELRALGPRHLVPYEITLIKPTLGHFHQLTHIFETQLTAGLQADFFWGMASLLLHLTAADATALSEIPRMLRPLGYMAEAFKQYHSRSTREDTDRVKEVCFDIQVQLVAFFAAAVKFVRDAQDRTQQMHVHQDHRVTQEDPWSLLERKYLGTNQAIREALARIDRNAPGRSEPDQTSRSDEAAAAGQILCVKLPTKIYPSFFDRHDVFARIDLVLGKDESANSFRAMALYGLGGVGKSSIAARYLERQLERRRYDTMFWVYAETTASLRQSFTDIALRLKLPGAQPNLHEENLIQVQVWLQSTDCSWLIVYDNVEEHRHLVPYWPEASRGNAIITTRNHNVAYRLATSAFEIASWDAKTGSEFLLFLLKDHIGRDILTETASAAELAEKLSGHALGISHMAGLIQGRSWSITEFMRIYLKDPRRLHKDELQAVWEVSFSTLDRNCRIFLGIASCLVSEYIPQELFEFSAEHGLPEDLAFCIDEFDFLNSIEPLMRLALIRRDKDARVFSCHRLVQMQFWWYLAPEERQQAFNNTVALIYRAFPKQSDSTNKNQLYQQWTQCNRCLQHILSLKSKFIQEHKQSKDFQSPLLFCELLKDCQRYLYEINDLKELEDVCELNLQALEMLGDQDRVSATDIRASTLSHQASMYESIGRVDDAIKLNIQGRQMRLEESPIQGGLLGGFEQNLAYNYNTANRHDEALLWFEKSRDTWIAWNIMEGRGADWPTVTKKNTARCLVYLERYDEAHTLLETSIREFQQESPLNWAMLAYAYFVRGIIERRKNELEAAEATFMEAQNMWFKGDQSRWHPFNAACMYKTGVACLDQGKVEAAIKHLRDSMEITKRHSSVMPVEHARCLFKLSEALLQDSPASVEVAGDTGDVSQDLRDEAETYLLRRHQGATDFGNEAVYDKWVPIFWR